MDYFVQLLFLAIAIEISTTFVIAEKITVFGLEGETIELQCNLPLGKHPVVEWVDRVYSSDDDPIKIFTSHENPHYEIEADHENRDNYMVNRQYALTISNLNIDEDVGEYTCQSKVGDKVHKKHYYLTIGELPTCSGIHHVKAGEKTTLSCEMSYSGNQPIIEWYEDKDILSSKDEYDIRRAKKTLNVQATQHKDGTKFVCRMSLGNTTHECSITLNVSYPVHEPKFHPVKETFKAGDELKCVAKGNPPPTMSLTPEISNAVIGPGWIAFIIEQQWEGHQKTIECSASNVVGGVTHTKSQDFAFLVSAREKPKHRHSTATTTTTTTTTTPEPVPPKKETPNHELADQEILIVKNGVSTTKSTPSRSHHPKPDVKPVRFDNSAGNFLISTINFTLLCLIFSMWL